MRGNVVGEATSATSATAPTWTATYDEFGVPASGTSRKYGWLGARMRTSELPGGAIQMGVRTYLPQLGRFLQPDPAPCGADNVYGYASQDPANQLDLDGRIPTRSLIACVRTCLTPQKPSSEPAKPRRPQRPA